MLFNSLASGVRKRSHIPKQMEYFIFFVRHSMNPIYNPKNFRTCVSPWDISFFCETFHESHIQPQKFQDMCFSDTALLLFFSLCEDLINESNLHRPQYLKGLLLWSWAWKANYDIHSKTEVICIVGRNKVCG